MVQNDPEILFIKSQNDSNVDSEVRLGKWDSISNQSNLIESSRKYSFQWTRSCFPYWTNFERFILISLIILNAILIGALFPIVSLSILRLDKLVNEDNILYESVKNNVLKDKILAEKMDDATNIQHLQKGQLGKLDGMIQVGILTQISSMSNLKSE